MDLLFKLDIEVDPTASAYSSYAPSGSENSNSQSPPTPPSICLFPDQTLPPMLSLDDPKPAQRMKSCAPCRVRRVKCERLFYSGSNECTQCIKKAIQCTEMPKKEKKSGGIARSGKRIDQAKALFGTKQYAGDESARTAFPKPTTSQTMVTNALASVAVFTPTDPNCNLIPDFSFLQPQSVENRIDAKEIQSAVVATLIDSYMDFAQARNLLVEQTGFRKDFERAGRRLDEMPDTSRVLTAVIIALSARVSDHPTFVGSNAPRIWELSRAGTEGRDLTEYGRQREAACHVLLDKAIELMDRNGCLRMPSIENVAALQLLEGLVEPSETSLHSPFAHAYFGHVRELIVAGQIEDHSRRTYIAGSVFGWTAWVRDAMMAAKIGRSPFFSEEDLELIRDGDPPAPSLEEALLRPPNPAPLQNFWTLFLPLMEHAANLARGVAKNLTGLFARRATRANIPYLLELMKSLEISYAAFPEIHARCHVFAQMNYSFSRDALGTTRSLVTSIMGLSFLVHRVIGQRLSARWKPEATETSPKDIAAPQLVAWPAWPGPEAEDDAYWAALLALRQRSHKFCYLATRRLSTMFEETLLTGVPVGSSQFIDGRGVQLLFSSIRMWLTPFIETPAAEQGGPVDFALQTKINELRWIHKAVCSVGWSYERLGKAEPWVRNEVTKLEKLRDERAAQAWDDIASGIGSSFSSASLPPSVFSAESANSVFSDDDLQALLGLTAGLPSELAEMTASGLNPAHDFVGADSSSMSF